MKAKGTSWRLKTVLNVSSWQVFYMDESLICAKIILPNYLNVYPVRGSLSVCSKLISSHFFFRLLICSRYFLFRMLSHQGVFSIHYRKILFIYGRYFLFRMLSYQGVFSTYYRKSFGRSRYQDFRCGARRNVQDSLLPERHLPIN